MDTKYLNSLLNREYMRVMVVEILFENSLLNEPVDLKILQEQLDRVQVFLHPQPEQCGDYLYALFCNLYRQYINCVEKERPPIVDYFNEVLVDGGIKV